MSEMDKNADNLHNMGGQTLKFSCENIEVCLRNRKCFYHVRSRVDAINGI